MSSGMYFRLHNVIWYSVSPTRRPQGYSFAYTMSSGIWFRLHNVLRDVFSPTRCRLEYCFAPCPQRVVSPTQFIQGYRSRASSGVAGLFDIASEVHRASQGVSNALLSENSLRMRVWICSAIFGNFAKKNKISKRSPHEPGQLDL